MRSAPWTVVLLAALAANAAHAQGDAAVPGAAQSPAASAETDAPGGEAPEQIIVSGKRLVELRVEVQRARERAYAIFNEINSTNDFDVHCRDEKKHHSRTTRRVCRAQFESRISSDAAKEYMASLTLNCPSAGGVISWQGCMFGPVGAGASSQARATELQAPPLHDRMTDEIQRLAEEDPRFGRAILDFYERNQQYEAARQRRED